MRTPNPDATPAPEPPRILLVEDNEATSKSMARLLESQGYAVAMALDGASALEALQTGPPPDFVLTDLRLPDLDGREVARFASRLVPRPRIALITGWDLDDDLELDRWGIDWVFPKPVNLSELFARLREPRPVPPAGPRGG